MHDGSSGPAERWASANASDGRPCGVVHDDAGRVRLGRGRDLVAAVLAHPDASVPSSNTIGCAVFEADLVVLALRLLAQEVERAVVEDVAVLVDLDEGRSLVLGGPAEDLRQVLPIVVDRACDERRLDAEGERRS